MKEFTVKFRIGKLTDFITIYGHTMNLALVTAGNKLWEHYGTGVTILSIELDEG